MKREELLRELAALPPEELASLLRRLRELGPVEPVARDAWLKVVDEFIDRYRSALERLAQQ